MTLKLKLSISFFFILIFMGLPPAMADDSTTVTDGTSSAATIVAELSSDRNLAFKSIFADSDRISLSYRIEIAPADQGASRGLYLVAVANGSWYTFNAQSRWVPWDRQIDSLQPFVEKTLNARESVTVVNADQLPDGEYSVYVGYRTDSGGIVYNVEPTTFAVFDQTNPGLRKIYSRTMITAYMRDGQASVALPGIFLVAFYAMPYCRRQPKYQVTPRPRYPPPTFKSRVSTKPIR